MIEVRKISKEDIVTVVQIHQDAFDGFFLTELGSDFLKLYYESVSENVRGILLGCYKDSQLVGFCAATTLSQGFNKKLVLDNIKSFFLYGFVIIIF